jgi:hypothetical protein
MYKPLATVALFFALCAPVYAEVAVSSFRILRNAGGTSIRINLLNSLSVRQPGPIVVTLWVRQRPQDGWQSVKVWKDIPWLAAYARVTRVLEKDKLVRQMADTADFQAMVQVVTPGQADVQQVTTYYSGR